MNRQVFLGLGLGLEFTPTHTLILLYSLLLVLSISLSARARYGINGLIRQSRMPPNVNLQKGDEIEVAPVRIDPSEKEVDLKFIRLISPGRGPEPEEWRDYTVGQQFEGTVFMISSQRNYILVELPDGFIAMLHETKMSDDLRQKLEQAEIQVGSSVRVQVVSVDAFRKQLETRDV